MSCTVQASRIQYLLPLCRDVMQNAGMRLFGGAQYHRAMAEFRFVAGSVAAPSVSREEIVNSCGVEDFHDGTNYYRSVYCTVL